MKKILTAIAVGFVAMPLATAAENAGPVASAPITPIEAPKDRAYPGEIQLAVDASDVRRRIVRVHETISGITASTVLLYPKWIPGDHAPSGPIDKIAGITVTANGKAVAWKRDTVDVYAFHVNAPSGIRSVDVDFEYLSATSPSVGTVEITGETLAIDWNKTVLYPAGYFSRQIPVTARLTVPAGWQIATALEPASAMGATTTFKRTNLETLIDSPVIAGQYAAQFDLDPGAPVPVHLDVYADRPERLIVKPEQLEAQRNLIKQAYRLFGSHHFAHYDFLLLLSDQLRSNGLEHLQSNIIGADPEFFTKWDKTTSRRDDMPHEFVHSWNGKFRRPADLWIPNFNVPMQNSLLWLYEGQTEYWGDVLTARSGMWTHQQALDKIALIAATYQNQTGRQWRSVQDTTNDEIINPRRPRSWNDWQRFEEYYDEGALIWLDADTLIREKSNGQRSLNDFALAFFGIDDGSVITVTYTFDDIVKALNAVEPYDWAGFLHQRLESAGKPVPLDGLQRGGYRLTYSDKPSEFVTAMEEQDKLVNLLFSIGIELNIKDKMGTVSQVIWDSPAFKAKITEGAEILAVNGVAYDDDVLKEAITAAKGTKSPIELIVKIGDRFLVSNIDYHDGLRYPHLERDESRPPRLDDIFAARP